MEEPRTVKHLIKLFSCGIASVGSSEIFKCGYFFFFFWATVCDEKWGRKFG